ncbi:hypothetical protein FOCG_18586 [Fusarium oxysporum f. sp. radicis-lycopersici 26381]|nr:hypothetical protein FOCG_18586 [Fusarium oxysporum f. sp. radicis-lycopersici 26381]
MLRVTVSLSLPVRSYLDALRSSIPSLARQVSPKASSVWTLGPRSSRPYLSLEIMPASTGMRLSHSTMPFYLIQRSWTLSRSLVWTPT